VLQSRSGLVQSQIAEEALGAVSDAATAVMVFGSFARGDASQDSDIDVLALAHRRSRPARTGRVNVSVYDENTLVAMAEHGALFVLHLRNEGQILRDHEGKLRHCLDSYRAPSSYETLRATLRGVANLLDASESEYSQRWGAYNELAVFLLRSLLYAHFAEEGHPVFSLRVIKKRMPRQNLDVALSLKAGRTPRFAEFGVARGLVEELLGSPVRNPFGTAEALITNLAAENPSVLAFGLRLLGRQESGFGYDLWTMTD